jgi:hypothetical protein
VSQVLTDQELSWRTHWHATAFQCGACASSFYKCMGSTLLLLTGGDFAYAPTGQCSYSTRIKTISKLSCCIVLYKGFSSGLKSSLRTLLKDSVVLKAAKRTFSELSHQYKMLHLFALKSDFVILVATGANMTGANADHWYT